MGSDHESSFPESRNSIELSAAFGSNSSFHFFATPSASELDIPLIDSHPNTNSNSSDDSSGFTFGPQTPQPKPLPKDLDFVELQLSTAPQPQLSIFHASRVGFRGLVLLQVGIMAFAANFCNDGPAALNLGMSPSQLGIIFSAYSLPNLVMPVLAGVVTHHLGVNQASLVFGIAYLLGGIIFGLSGWTKAFAGFLLRTIGRAVSGLGGEALSLARTVTISEWFEGKELALAFGISTTLSRSGSIFAFWILPLLQERYGLAIAQLLLVVMVFLVICMVLTIWTLDIRGKKQLLEDIRSVEPLELIPLEDADMLPSHHTSEKTLSDNASESTCSLNSSKANLEAPQTNVLLTPESDINPTSQTWPIVPPVCESQLSLSAQSPSIVPLTRESQLSLSAQSPSIAPLMRESQLSLSSQLPPVVLLMPESQLNLSSQLPPIVPLMRESQLSLSSQSPPIVPLMHESDSNVSSHSQSAMIAPLSKVSLEEAKEEKPPSTLTLLKEISLAFWLLNVTSIAYYLTVQPALSFIPTFLMDFRGVSLTKANQIASLSRWAAMIFSIFSGLVIDKVGFRSHILLFSFSLMVPGFLLFMVKTIPPVVLGLTIAPTYTITPAVLWPCFTMLSPLRVRALSLGIAFCSMNFGSTVGPILFGVLRDATDSWFAGLGLFAFIVLVGCISTLFLMHQDSTKLDNILRLRAYPTSVMKKKLR